MASGDHVVVACSGGADSVALALFLHELAPELGFALTVATVDHGLRAEARDEAASVERLARAWGRPFELLELHLESGPGLQARARDRRLAALRDLAVARGAGRVAVGHTADDQAETVLARLLRGAGIDGLGAMRPSRPLGELQLVRPWLTTGREALRTWLRSRGVPWATDPSNDDDHFERVRLRRWLDQAHSEDSALVRHLTDLAADARDQTELVNLELERRSLVGAPVAALAAAPRALRRAALKRWAEGAADRKVGRAHLEALEALVRRGKGEVLLPGGRAARIEAGALQLGDGPARTRSSPKRPAPGDGDAR